MSLRTVDIRFALQRNVRRAVVLGDLPEWVEGFRQSGVELVDAGDSPDVAVASAAHAGSAVAAGAPLIVLEQARRSATLGRAGYAQLAVLTVPNAARPELLLPLGQRNAIRYAIRHWRPGSSRLGQARSLVASELLGRGIAPPGRTPTIVAAREPGAPFLVAAAAQAIGVDRVHWFAAFGPWAHAESRGALYLFEPTAEKPAWVVKFTRVGGLGQLFEGDEAGLALAEHTGGVVAASAPTLVGRLALDGDLHASVETAATGKRLAPLLRAPTGRTERLAVVEQVASWIVTVAGETASPPEALEPELRRLDADVVPAWTKHGVPVDLVTRLPTVGAVFQHGDLWADNIFVDGDVLSVIDWESARPAGTPLWDLLYFLTDALALVDGAESDADRIDHFVRLWRGDLESSVLAFRWVRAAVAATAVPAEAVGPLATLLWLSYALLDVAHVDRVGSVERRVQKTEPPTWRMSTRWLADAALGPAWNAWRNG